MQAKLAKYTEIIDLCCFLLTFACNKSILLARQGGPKFRIMVIISG